MDGSRLSIKSAVCHKTADTRQGVRFFEGVLKDILPLPFIIPDWCRKDVRCSWEGAVCWMW